MDLNSKSTNTRHPTTMLAYESSPTTNTTFVRADPSNFRAVVQKLTGSSTETGPPFSAQNLPSMRPAGSDEGIGRSSTEFRLHERRQTMSMRKLDMITFNRYGPAIGLRVRGGSDVALVSPVSTLDGLGLGLGLCSPRTPTMNSEEEERAIIAEKGFYLHPVSPLNRIQRDCEPQLLPLFPLHSPRDHRV